MFQGPLSQALEENSIAKVLQNKELYDGKEVVVSGEVSKLKFKTSKSGKDYTTFSLKCKGKNFSTSSSGDIRT
ncbi:MAG: hypothetical protein QW304_09150 [Thermoproteota archaeon]